VSGCRCAGKQKVIVSTTHSSRRTIPAVAPERAAEAFAHALAAADGPPLYMPSLQDPRAVLDRAQGGDIAMPPPWPNPTLA
jgi:hypothetical protein